jgi:hypothetical protein
MALPQGTMSFDQIGCFGLAKNAALMSLAWAGVLIAETQTPPTMANAVEAAITRANRYPPVLIMISPCFIGFKE